MNSLKVTLILLCLLPILKVFAVSSLGAAMVITQFSFNEGLDRFDDEIQELIDMLVAQTWPDDGESGGDCEPTWWVHGGQATGKHVTVTNLKVLIRGDQAIQWSADITISANVPVYYRYRQDEYLWCDAWTICNGRAIPMTFWYHAVTAIRFGIDPQGAVVASADLESLTSLRNPYIGGCNDYPDYIGWFEDVEQDIFDKIQEAADNFANTLAYSVTIPQTVPTGDYTWIVYQATGFQFFENSHVIFSVNTSVIATSSESGFTKNLTFNADPCDANINVPMNWPLNPQGSLQPLTGVQLSSTLMTAMVWAANVTGSFDFAFNTTSLDTTLVMTLIMMNFQMGIPSDGNITLYLESGELFVSCKNAETSVENVLVDLNFYNLNGTGHYYTTDPPGVAVQLDQFNYSNFQYNQTKPEMDLPYDVILSM